MNMLNADAGSLSRLNEARASSIRAGEGLLRSNDEALNPAWERFGDSIAKRLGYASRQEMPEHAQARYRVMAGWLENQLSHMIGLQETGQLPMKFRSNPAGLFLRSGSMTETTTSADVAPFIRDVIAFVLPVFEKLIVGELIHIESQQGPQAYIFNLDYTYADSGGMYEAGTSLQGNLDINYADCPTECGEANGINLNLTRTTVIALCKRLVAKWCIQAEQDYFSQHGRSIAADTRGMIQLQMARERQGEVFQQLVAGAGYSGVWSSSPEAGSIYNDLDPKVYQKTLWDAVVDADNAIFTSVDGQRTGNFLLGDPDSLTRLNKLNEFKITTRDALPRAQAGTGSVEEFGNFFGVANFQYNVWKAPTFTPNTLLVGVKSDAPQERGFVHAEYIPLADLGVFLDPKTAEISTSLMSRYSNSMIRSGLYATVTIT